MRLPALALLLALPAYAHDARPAVVRGIHDCDTISVTIELGFGLLLDQSVRVYGIDAPEVTGAEKAHGLECRERAVRKWLQVGDRVLLIGPARDKYGRVLAGVEMPNGRDLAAELVRWGWALPWNGNGPDPVYPPEATYPLEVAP